MGTVVNIEKIREEVGRLDGTISEPTPTANWIELHGFFTPAQLRQLAKTVEKQYVGKK